jgi:hypothetical protein
LSRADTRSVGGTGISVGHVRRRFFAVSHDPLDGGLVLHREERVRESRGDEEDRGYSARVKRPREILCSGYGIHQTSLSV